MSGLALLTGNYTDSEDEDQNIKDSDDENTGDSMAVFPASGPGSNAPLTNNATPNSETGSMNFASNRSTPSKKPALNLVSYVDILDDNDDKDVEAIPIDIDSNEDGSGNESGINKERQTSGEEANTSGNSALNRSNSVQVDAWTGGGRLPNEPTGLCSPKIQESVNKAMKKKQEYGYDMNLVIQRKKMFRNPSIYEKLIQFCEIDETGTNLPKDLYDGHLFGKESFYDELAKVQKQDMEKREKAAKERNANIERSKEELVAKVTGTKRKSKWDQAAPLGAPQPPITSIPAFGALSKK